MPNHKADEANEADLLAFSFDLKPTKLTIVLQCCLAILVGLSCALVAWFTLENVSFSVVTFSIATFFTLYWRESLLEFYPAQHISWHNTLNANQLNVDKKTVELHSLWFAGAFVIFSGRQSKAASRRWISKIDTRVLLVRSAVSQEAWHAFNVWRVWRIKS